MADHNSTFFHKSISKSLNEHHFGKNRTSSSYITEHPDHRLWVSESRVQVPDKIASSSNSSFSEEYHLEVSSLRMSDEFNYVSHDDTGHKANQVTPESYQSALVEAHLESSDREVLSKHHGNPFGDYSNQIPLPRGVLSYPQADGAMKEKIIVENACTPQNSYQYSRCSGSAGSKPFVIVEDENTQCGSSVDCQISQSVPTPEENSSAYGHAMDTYVTKLNDFCQSPPACVNSVLLRVTSTNSNICQAQNKNRHSPSGLISCDNKRAPYRVCGSTPARSDSNSMLTSSDATNNQDCFTGSPDMPPGQIKGEDEQEATPSTSGKSNTEWSKNSKPPISYIELIGKAILSTQDKQMILQDIYLHIMSQHSYYNNNSKAWRNSVRHNLSLNECFEKSNRTGKGHFWKIHANCLEDFANGDFRRRRARHRAQKKRSIDPSPAYNFTGSCTNNDAFYKTTDYGTNNTEFHWQTEQNHSPHLGSTSRFLFHDGGVDAASRLSMDLRRSQGTAVLGGPGHNLQASPRAKTNQSRDFSPSFYQMPYSSLCTPTMPFSLISQSAIYPHDLRVYTTKDNLLLSPQTGSQSYPCYIEATNNPDMHGFPKISLPSSPVFEARPISSTFHYSTSRPISKPCLTPFSDSLKMSSCHSFPFQGVYTSSAHPQNKDSSFSASSPGIGFGFVGSNEFSARTLPPTPSLRPKPVTTTVTSHHSAHAAYPKYQPPLQPFLDLPFDKKPGNEKLTGSPQL